MNNITVKIDMQNLNELFNEHLEPIKADLDKISGHLDELEKGLSKVVLQVKNTDGSSEGELKMKLDHLMPKLKIMIVGKYLK